MMENDINTICCINGEKYAFDLLKIKDFCLTSDKEQAKEKELIDNFESNETNNSLELVSRISREVKSAGNPQNDTILYDSLKVFIMTVLDNDNSSQDTFKDMSFSTAIAFNSLLNAGIIYKIE